MLYKPCSGGTCIKLEGSDWRIIETKQWRKGGGILLNINLPTTIGTVQTHNQS